MMSVMMSAMTSATMTAGRRQVEAARAPRPRGRRLRAFGVYLVLLVGAVTMMLPFAFTVSTSLKPVAYVLELPPRLIPRPATIRNYVDAWRSNRFRLYFLNSLKVAAVSATLTVGVASTQAYAFARLRFPGRNVLFGAYLFMMMVPQMITLIPQFILVRNMGLLDSHTGLVMIYVVTGLPLQTFLLKGFFERIPRELEECAYLDGANRFQMFWSVSMPLVKPALATVAIFSFLYSWDEFTWALTSINDINKRTLPIAVRLFQGQHVNQWGLVFAASVIAVLPVILVFVFFQRYFIRGMMTGAVKG